MPSSTDLLDANVWLALAVEAHSHHGRAKKYWQTEAAPRTAFCRVTHLAVLRHLTNRAVMGGQRLTSAGAWKKGAEFLALPEVQILPEPTGLDAQLETFCKAGPTSPNWWTDAYLAAFAKCAGLRLTTFDQGFSRFSGLNVLILRT